MIQAPRPNTLTLLFAVFALASSASLAQAPGAVAQQFSAKLTISAAGEIRPQIEQCLSAALEDLEGVTLVTEDEEYSIRVLVLPSSSDTQPDSYFFSILVLSSQRDTAEHVEFLRQHCPEFVRAKKHGGGSVGRQTRTPMAHRSGT